MKGFSSSLDVTVSALSPRLWYGTHAFVSRFWLAHLCREPVNITRVIVAKEVVLNLKINFII